MSVDKLQEQVHKPATQVSVNARKKYKAAGRVTAAAGRLTAAAGAPSYRGGGPSYRPGIATIVAAAVPAMRNKSDQNSLGQFNATAMRSKALK